MCVFCGTVLFLYTFTQLFHLYMKWIEHILGLNQTNTYYLFYAHTKYIDTNGVVIRHVCEHYRFCFCGIGSNYDNIVKDGWYGWLCYYTMGCTIDSKSIRKNVEPARPPRIFMKIKTKTFVAIQHSMSGLNVFLFTLLFHDSNTMTM